MNKRFRTMRVLLFTAAAVLGLTGCSNRNADFEQVDQQLVIDQDVSITLAVQSYADEKTLENLLNQFHELHPGYEVKLLNLPQDRYDEILNMRMTSGEGPDVFQVATDWLNTYISKNWLMDLSQVVEPTFQQAFPQWALNYTKDNGHFYAIPSDMMTFRLIYNKDLLQYAGLNPEVPPKTLADLRNYANQVSTAGIGYRKYGFALPAGEDETFRNVLEIASTYSGAYYYNFATGKYDFTVYQPWFETMTAMKKEGGLFPGETSLQSDTALTQFAEGNIGMMVVSNHDYATLNRMKPMSFSWGVAMPPLLEKSDQGKGALMEYPEPPLAINAYSTHKKEAVELWEFLHSPEVQGTLYKQGDSIPTLEGIKEDPRYHSQLPQFAAFLPSSEDSPYPREPKFILQNIQTLFSPKNLGGAARVKAYRDI
ncbi:MAG: ABC transporter substrate-binding protein, partial [Gorillibacterium sp.]|nr:ABC transporter substrate-binding protein [Gorillibacterium sp.]